MEFNVISFGITEHVAQQKMPEDNTNCGMWTDCSNCKCRCK